MHASHCRWWLGSGLPTISGVGEVRSHCRYVRYSAAHACNLVPAATLDRARTRMRELIIIYAGGARAWGPGHETMYMFGATAVHEAD